MVVVVDLERFALTQLLLVSYIINLGLHRMHMSLVRFSKAKFKALHIHGSGHQRRLGDERSPAQKDLGAPTDEKLDTSWK